MSVTSYRFRIYPNAIQRKEILEIFGTCRYAYNHYLEYWRKNKDNDGFVFNVGACLRDFTKFRVGKLFLYDTDVTAVRNAIHSLREVVWKYNRHKSGLPKYKSKKSLRQSYKTSNVSVKDGCVKIPKVGKIKACITRDVEGKIVEAIIVREGTGKYYISLICNNVQKEQFEKTGAVVGIDVGVHNLATFSDGNTIENKRFYGMSKKRIKKLRKRLSRKSSESNNRRKAQQRLCEAIERFRCQRLDYTHKATTQIVKDYDIICVEDLNILGMMQNKEMFEHIADAAFGTFLRQLEYKCEYYGKTFIRVPRYFASTKICNVCGYKNNKIRLSDRKWTCPVCGVRHDRDLNAANNILESGIQIYMEAMGTSPVVCGDSISPVSTAAVDESESGSNTKVQHE